MGRAGASIVIGNQGGCDGDAASQWRLAEPDTDRLVLEKAALEYTFVDRARFEARLPALRRFLHRLGRETNQGEVVCEFKGQLFKIRDYDGGDDAGA